MKNTAIFLTILALAGCSKPDSGPVVEEAADAPDVTASVAPAPDPADRLARVLESQSDEAKARYGARHPAETLAFFGIEPGMSVVEVLPGGGGWYTKILIPYIGSEGALHGIDYAVDMWAEFPFATPEMIEQKKTWPTDWAADAVAMVEGNAPQITGHQFGGIDESAHGTMDAVLMIRALHNMRRFEEKGGYLTQALTDTYNLLKPGGVLGIVQHRSPESNSDAHGDGTKGYLKESFIKEIITKAGFEFVGSSDINANSADQPGEDDIVWRLPPTLGTSGEDPELREKMQAIGESSRMTLKFRKPTGS